MSGYSNFGKGLNDQSAQGWAQGAAMVGQAFSNFGKTIANTIKQNQAEQTKVQDKYDLTFGDVSLNENKIFNSTREAILEKGTSGKITDMLLNSQKILMNGVGEKGDADYKMGSIEAQTLIKTEKGLNKDKREEYQELVNIADANLQNVLKRGGVLMTEVEEIKQVVSNGMAPGKDKAWRGGSFSERLASSFTSFRLNNNQVTGVETTENLNNENGDLTFTHTISKSSNLIGKLDIDKFNTWDKTNMKDDGKGNWIITQTLGQDFTGDLLRDVKPAINYRELAASPEVGIISKGGNLDQQYVTRLANRTTTMLDGSMYDTNIDFIDKSKIDAKFSNAMAGKVEGILALDPQAKIDYLTNRRGQSFSMDFTLKTPAQQRVIIEEIENDALVSELGQGDWKKRKMTPQEAAMLVGKNGNPVQSSEDYDEWLNADHYFDETNGQNFTVQEKALKKIELKDVENKGYFTNPKFVETPKKGMIIEGFRGNTSKPSSRIIYRDAVKPESKIRKIPDPKNPEKLMEKEYYTKAKPAGWYLETMGSESVTQNTGIGQSSQSAKAFIDAGKDPRSLEEWSGELGYGLIK